ncbi:MAG: GWxTD domain-containing protein [Ignavibacteriales bacterium]|nr:GWxTD domain-containing protein [Ignavibacteriales bacterium]
MTLRSLKLFALFVVCGINIAFAQRGMLRPDIHAQNPFVSYETVVLPGPDSSTTTVNIHYRISERFFIFVRNEGEPNRTEYIARGELMVELLNDQKVSVAREIRQIGLTHTSPTKETDRPNDLQGGISFSVPGGLYQVVFSLDDRESGRSFIDKERKITAVKPQLQPLEVTHPMFVRAFNKTHSTNEFILLNRGGDILFGSRGGLLIQLYLPNSTIPLSVQWKIEGNVEELGLRKQNFSGSEYTLKDGLLKLITREQGLSYTLEPSPLPWKILYLPVAPEQFESGLFKIEIEYSQGNLKQKKNYSFRVEWPSRPFSLVNPELAIDALRHIASEAELQELQSGSAVHRAEAFYQFWRKRDRDTTTAYNEMMTEYYVRVDESLRKFSTSRDGDGYKTDRGRIYILYGAPTRSDRILQPGGSPTEIWIYETIKRRFVFIDPTKTGNFILSQAENL